MRVWVLIEIGDTQAIDACPGSLISVFRPCPGKRRRDRILLD